MRSLTGGLGNALGAIVFALAFAFAGCASSGSQGAHASATAADQAQAPPLPPLPDRISAAVPLDAHDVLHIDLAQTRASADLAPLLDWAHHVPCLQRGEALSRMLAQLSEVALVSWQPGDDGPELMLLLQGPGAGAVPEPDALLATFAPAGQGPAKVVEQGRHRVTEQGPLAAAALGGPVRVLGTTARVRALLASLDQPGQAGRAYFDGQPAPFSPGTGRALSWITQGLDARAASELGSLAGKQVATAITGVPARGAIETSPLRLSARGELRSPADAEQVATRSKARLQQAGLLLRLLGLPLHEQLQLTPRGATLDVSLPLTASQAQRLRKLAEGAVPDAGARLCRDLASLGFAP